MIGITTKYLQALLLAVSFAAPAFASGPAIPAQFAGVWSPSGACETVYSDGVSIDAGEVMFGETGFFVEDVSKASETDAVITVGALALTPRGTEVGVKLTLHLLLSESGRVLTISETNRSTTYRRCPASP